MLTAVQRDIEQYSPQICGRDEEIWVQLIKQDAPGWKPKVLSPRNNRDWYQLYQKTVAETNAEVALDEQILKTSMDLIVHRQMEKTTKQVRAATVPKLPMLNGMRADEPPPPRPKFEMLYGPRSKTLTGYGVLEKVRREARQESRDYRQSKAFLQRQKVPIRASVEQPRPVAVQPRNPTIKPAEGSAAKRKRVDLEKPAHLISSASSSGEEPPTKKPKNATISAETAVNQTEKASIVGSPSPPLPPLPAKHFPRLQLQSQTARPMRPPMKKKKEISIFIVPAKQRRAPDVRVSLLAG